MCLIFPTDSPNRESNGHFSGKLEEKISPIQKIHSTAFFLFLLFSFFFFKGRVGVGTRDKAQAETKDKICLQIAALKC